jgi:hypothetical protein
MDKHGDFMGYMNSKWGAPPRMTFFLKDMINHGIFGYHCSTFSDKCKNNLRPNQTDIGIPLTNVGYGHN